MQTTRYSTLWEELQWRELVQDAMPGVKEHLSTGKRNIYIGFDPTADSLHVGSLVPITLLKRIQDAGHIPVALIGGATAMIGDPSGKSKERNLLSREEIEHNAQGIKTQLERFIEFGEHSGKMVNNADWFAGMPILDFMRNIGKHLTVNYMMAKDSVKSRLETGISFTEFSYQLIQGYDFQYLFEHEGCTVQMGGSDQWGNIVSGTELIRRAATGQAYAVTSPLITKGDGTKFGKSEGGNIWLDQARTSPYAFYQFWLQASDEDSIRYAKVFSFASRAEIEAKIAEHLEKPGARILQQSLAQEMTEMVHGAEALSVAKDASAVLFGKSTTEVLSQLPDSTIDEIFEGVKHVSLKQSELLAMSMEDLFCEHAQLASSKSQARRDFKGNAFAVNKIKISIEHKLQEDDLIKGKYLILQKGKKQFVLVHTI